MILLFYSNECNLCKAILKLIEEFNIKDKYKLIDVHKLAKIPDNITVVPTIIESELKALVEGKDVYQFIVNQKFFYYPTNNIDLWANKEIPKPNIVEDNKALNKKSLIYYYFNSDETKQFQKNDFSSFDTVFNSNIVEKKTPIIKDKKTLALLKLKKY